MNAQRAVASFKGGLKKGGPRAAPVRAPDSSIFLPRDIFYDNIIILETKASIIFLINLPKLPVKKV